MGVSSKWPSFSLLVLCIVLHLSALTTLGDDKLDKTRFHGDDDCRFGGNGDVVEELVGEVVLVEVEVVALEVEEVVVEALELGVVLVVVLEGV